MPATFVTLWLQVVQPLANVHETKWTPHVKRETDVAQSYTSSEKAKREKRTVGLQKSIYLGKVFSAWTDAKRTTEASSDRLDEIG